MARMAEDLIEQVDNYKPEVFEPLEDGVYVLSFEEDVEVKVGPKGTYWAWKFVANQEDNPGMTRTKVTLFHNTSLSEKAAFKLHETYAAFGVSARTDTEDLVGQKVRGKVIQQVIEQGKRAGEIGNSLDELLPKNAAAETDDIDKALAAEAKKQPGPGKKSDKPLF